MGDRLQFVRDCIDTLKLEKQILLETFFMILPIFLLYVLFFASIILTDKTDEHMKQYSVLEYGTPSTTLSEALEMAEVTASIG